jgi:hypothetical protein
MNSPTLLPRLQYQVSVISKIRGVIGVGSSECKHRHCRPTLAAILNGKKSMRAASLRCSSTLKKTRDRKPDLRNRGLNGVLI